MARGYFVLRAKTLLNGAYFLIVLDALLFLAWVAGGFYVLSECAVEVNFHVIIALHFLQVVSILAVLSDWYANLKEGSHRLSDSTPVYWIAGSIIAFFGDLFLFSAQFRIPNVEECQIRLLHKVLDGSAMSICVVSIVWFVFVAIATRHAQSHDKRERQKALDNPDNVYGDE